MYINFFLPGKPIGGNLCSHYLTVFTLNGIIKIFDIHRHDPKLMAPPKSGYDLFPNFGEIIMAKCNSEGTFVVATIATESLVPDGKMYLWNLETDLVRSFDFIGKLGGTIPDTFTPRLVYFHLVKSF